MYELIVILVLLIIGYGFGQHAEKKHFRKIKERENDSRYRNLAAFSSRFPPHDRKIDRAHLVSGNVVVSIDYFKSFAAGLRGLIGGRINSFETLIERARREAILRMKEDAMEQGFEQIFNVKLETSSISKGRKNKLGTVEVYAYGTGLKYL